MLRNDEMDDFDPVPGVPNHVRRAGTGGTVTIPTPTAISTRPRGED